MPPKLTIATRESPLALWQAEHVRSALRAAHPTLAVELLGMTSRGDQLLDVPLAKVGGKGLFVKELETALLDRSADIAVHSMKDVPMDFPAGLGLGVICEREDPTDAFVSNMYRTLEDLPAGSVVEIEARVKRLRSRMGQLEGFARVDGNVVVNGAMTFAPERLAGWMVGDGLDARLQLQLHKLVWGPDRRGV